ncbi:hypothetical protein [Silvibacterium acidisoli]|uniref:hypothetical protein n=1 Tax=Acidobacteriaceae bacterium ZG23-2 TaxID=2883246 RepID=UPI00406D18B4
MTTKNHDHPSEAAKHSNPASVQPTETEHGHPAGKKQAQHEALQDNVDRGQEERHPDTPAGQHSTGSFTGTGKQTR